MGRGPVVPLPGRIAGLTFPVWLFCVAAIIMRLQKKKDTIMTKASVIGAAGRPSLFAPLISAVRAWRVARQTAAELNALSDRELQDIGIIRYDIAAIASESGRSASSRA